MQFYCIVCVCVCVGGGGGALGGPETSQYLVWPPFASRSATHLLHIELIRLLIVACGMLVLFNGCKKLLDIDRNWNTLSYTPIQSIPNMLNGWRARWVYWPCKNWDVFSFQELVYRSLQHGAVHYHAATWGDGCGWMAQQWASGPRHGISKHSKCHQLNAHVFVVHNICLPIP